MNTIPSGFVGWGFVCLCGFFGSCLFVGFGFFGGGQGARVGGDGSGRGFLA